MDPTFLPPSPASRRRHRGRGVIVLDNVTATTVTNSAIPAFGNAITPDGSFAPEGGVASILGPSPSPDEMVINARGRRAIPLTFSPDVHTTPLSQRLQRTHPGMGNGYGRHSNGISQLARGGGGVTSHGSNIAGWQTPPNSVTRLLLPTRTSPRKRLTLTDSPPGSSLHSASTPSPSPEKQNHSASIIFSRKSPVIKRFRMMQSAGSMNEDVDPITKLKGLSHDQLTTLLTELIQKRPEIREDVKNLMPQPDIVAMEENLNYLKRNIYKSLPNTRLESKTDSMAYNRVSTHLLAFKKAITDQSKRLCDAHAWMSVVDYSVMAWSYVKSTPVWDNQPHNNIRRYCFKLLAANSLQAIKRGVWNAEASSKLKDRMSAMEKDSDDIGLCIKQLDIIINNGNHVANEQSLQISR